MNAKERSSPVKWFLACALLLGACTAARAGESVERLTLKQAVALAAERNLDARAELYSVAQSVAEVERSQAIYDPALSLQTQYSYTPVDLQSAGVPLVTAPTVPGGTVVPQEDPDPDSENFQLDVSLSRLLPSGGTVAAVFNNLYTTATMTNSTLDSYWYNLLGVTYVQPLLKNFGRDTTELQIAVSRISRDASLEHFRGSLTTIVSRVRTEYFRLYSLREAMLVKRASLDLARKILGETQSRFQAGVIPALEILNAEFGVASREKELNDAEKLVQDQVDTLRVLLQLPAGLDIAVVDEPRIDQPVVDEAAQIRRALDRPDILEQRKNLEIAELQARIDHNRVRPDLSVNASTFLTSQDADYFGSITDTPTWSVGLNLSYPLGNSAAENDYRKSRLRADQIALRIKSLEEGAANEVRAAIRAMNVSAKQIEVTNRGRAFAEDRLRAFIRKSEVGMATTKDVLDAETDLMEAKNGRIQAAADYVSAVTRLWTATGELIEQSGISITGEAADRLYGEVR
jgi:outer membrane protein TolC